MKLRADNETAIELALSRRNLLTLLHKLDDPTSKRTIYKRCGDKFVAVVAEEDDAHYEGKQAGVMSPDTEAFIVAHSQKA